MFDITGQTVTTVTGNGQLSIGTDAGWWISIESDIQYSQGEQELRQLSGDDSGTASILSPVLCGYIIQSVTIADNGLILHFSSNAKLVALTDDEFEAWNIVGPRGQRVVSTPGGELATWQGDIAQQ